MGDHDTPATCLSSFEHGNFVRDTFLHYFGCLKFVEREAYFQTLEPHEKERIEAENFRIQAQRAYFEEDSETKLLVDRLKASLIERIPRLVQRVSFDGVPTKPCKENAYGLNAYMIFFKNSAPFTNEFYLGNFPDQRIAVKDILYNENKELNPLMKDCGDDEIRYFHLPGNNMEWIEEAMARYYNKPRPDYDGLFRRPHTPTKPYMLLRPEFWRGQQHGGRHDAIHARHMRPRCDIISTDPDNLEESPKNLVLFMPYLHWETDRQRTKFDETMRNISEVHAKEERARHLERLEEQKRKVNPNGTATTANINRDSRAPANATVPTLTHMESEFRVINTVTGVFDAVMQDQVATNPQSKFSKSKVAKLLTSKGLLAPGTNLGKILYRAALLSEAMDNYQEQELLKAYLYHNPPFHPRRTLDQSYYWTLKTTKQRDRDQVVYRGTAPKKEFMHSGEHVESGCLHCWRAIRKVPRVVMVDQLWLWILDGNTIITSFPKRYGRNKPDPSAVHKSIRMRLSVCRKGEINSAYDLALIILDQCSRVFFDRTKTADRQPQVMDLFASAIGDITYKQTIAYDHFWETALQVSHIYKSKDPVDDAEDKAKSLLDINPEGKLLREIKDILDEIHIMTNIKKKQHRVFKQFRKHVEHIFAPELSSAKELGTAKPKEVTGNTSTPEALESGHSRIRRVNSTERDKQEKSAKRTLEFANELAADLDDRVTDLTNLRESAEHTEHALNGLLGLKQQQASVVQARKSVQQTEETLRQGRSILLFTIITIIFLPLSFGATFFGMNANDFEDGKWTVRQEIIYIIPISCGIILTCFILAFSSFTRSLLRLMVSVSWTWFVTRTRLYSLWEHFKIDSLHLTKMRKDTASKWKETARAERHARREARQRTEDDKTHKTMRSEEERKKKEDATIPPGTV